MTLGETRLTRTAAGTGGAATGERTEVTQATGPGQRALVGAAVRAARVAVSARSRLAAAAGRVRRTVRPAGVLALGAATVGLGAGVLFGWVEAIVAGVAALVLLALSVPFLFASREYEVALRLDRERIVAGQSARARLVVRNAGRRAALPGRIDIPIGRGLIELGAPFLRPGGVSEHVLDLPPQPRGIVRIGPAISVRSDPLGLLRREHAVADARELHVHPRTTAVPSSSAGLIRDLDGSPTGRLVDADMSFHAIREYAPGDARRQVHWKSTAKTRRLMVRQYEESRRSRMAVVLGLARPEYDSADEFELAVSVAASLAVRAVHDARDLDVVVGVEIPRVVRGRVRAIRHIPAATRRTLLDGFSGVARLENTMPLPDVCRLTAEVGDRLSVAVLVTGSHTGIARLRQAALAFPADVAVVAVVCDERAHPRTRVLGGLAVVTVGTLEDLSGLMLRGAAE
ncbi:MULTISPECIES: DUF58 domain-containing protein [unclassified Microbacterium]|uniref:DUF58 domain-containing protein n=1 Tax=unclassified Microbacterium TaxID=2609290 RepID=UPI00301A57A3